MIKPKIYLDMSVFSALLDERTLDRHRLTGLFWEERLPDFESYISVLVELEVRDIPDYTKRQRLQKLISEFESLNFNEEADGLSFEYIKQRIFPAKYSADANHVAIAVVHGMDYFISWNFKHLVRVQTRREVNLINALNGYMPIEIIAPPEL